MDQFITITKEKETAKKVIGRKDIIIALRNALNNNKTICLYGDTGIGKTYVTEAVLTEYRYIELGQRILKSKNSNDLPYHVFMY